MKMKKQPKHLLPLTAAALLALLTAASCSDDTPPTPTPVELTEIVTVDQPSAPARFTALRVPPQHDAMLTADISLPETIKPGQRILLHYSAQDTVAQPVRIRVLGYAPVATGKVKVVSRGEARELPPPQASLISRWLTGPYINMQLMMRFDGTPRTLSLAADRESLTEPALQLYLYNGGQEVTPDYVDTRTFASYDLTGLLRSGQTINLNL